MVGPATSGIGRLVAELLSFGTVYSFMERWPADLQRPPGRAVW
jgi:hypothetical protein